MNIISVFLKSPLNFKLLSEQGLVFFKPPNASTLVHEVSTEIWNYSLCLYMMTMYRSTYFCIHILNNSVASTNNDISAIHISSYALSIE